MRILVDFKGSVPSLSTGELQKNLLENVLPNLPGQQLRNAFLVAVESGESIKYMPNRVLSAKPVSKRGVFILGDTMNCRHPLTGGAQTVILSDIVLLRDLLSDVNCRDYRQVQKSLQIFEKKRVPVAATINILANALYAIFSSQDENMDRMRTAVLQYFALGGVCVNGPVSFLSGLDTRPYYLLAHFFAVAFYGSFRLIFPYLMPWNIINAGKLIYGASKLVLPIINNERLFS